MSEWTLAIQLSVTAFLTLIIICLLFILIGRALGWLGRVTAKKEKPVEAEVVVPDEGDKRKQAVIAAAVMSYLESERPSYGRRNEPPLSLSPESEKGENE